MMNTEQDTLVTIMTMENGFKANLLRVRLEDSGIQAFVFDENVATINPLYHNLIGGIKVKIKESDKEKALELLKAENYFELTTEAGEILQCPKCQSENIEPGIKSVRSVKSFFALFFGLITGTYPLHLDNLYYCNSCGNLFKN